jgi:hypothetical protein
MHYFDNNGLGYILGDSFTNSSGHPGPNLPNLLARDATLTFLPKLWAAFKEGLTDGIFSNQKKTICINFGGP